MGESNCGSGLMKENKPLIIRYLKKLFYDKGARFGFLTKLGLFRLVSDRKFVEWYYQAHTGKKVDWNNLQTFNEKLLWLIVHDRDPQHTMMVDKYAVKAWVADKIGGDHVIPTIGVWNSFNEIDFEKLPDAYVLKCTHDSGGVVLCQDKKTLNKKDVGKTLRKSLRHNYYNRGREWPYKNVPHRIIAEPYLVDESGTELKDYKIFCFDGEPKMIQVDFDRFTNHHRNLYTTEWEYIDATIKFPTQKDRIIQKPDCLDEMLDAARKLSKGMVHVRVDFYVIGKKFYFGEMTFFHGGGCEKFTPEEFGYTVGSWLHLPEEPRLR